MRALELQSERFVPTGNVSSEGVLNQIGRPRLDLLTVLVREAVQNSWDAREHPEGGVEFSVESWLLTPEQGRVLVEMVLLQRPPNTLLDPVIADAVGGRCRVLALSDRGTVGLGGPTRADVIERHRESRNFLNLLRNVGQPTKRQHGGTFGFGKAALFLASGAHALCVHSRCHYHERDESRFMAAALGERYQIDHGEEEGIYTGRHWWGRWEDDLVEPARDEDGDALAAAIGMPITKDGERGTTLLVLAPRIGDRGTAAANEIADALLWNCWPKMVGVGGKQPAMTFRVVWDGKPVDIPDPRKHPQLSAFVRSLERLRVAGRSDSSDSLWQVSAIRCERPKRHLGMLALEKSLRARPEAPSTGADEASAPVGDPAHHVALLRRPELVVKYLDGPVAGAPSIQYGGVFLVDEAADTLFAKSEPPTHDDWTFQALEDPHERTFVRVALRRLREQMQAFVQVAPPGATARERHPLGAVAGYLGEILSEQGPGAAIVGPPEPDDDGEEGGRSGGGDGQGRGGNGAGGGNSGSGGSGSGSGTGGGSRARQPRPRIVVSPGRLEAGPDGAELHIPVGVIAAVGSSGTVVRADPVALLDGEVAEQEPPQGKPVPRVLRWVNQGGVRDVRFGPELHVPASRNAAWTVVVSVPDDTIVEVTFSASARRA